MKGKPHNPLLDLVPAEAASVPALFAAQVERRPEATFLLWEGERWSYEEAWREIRRFAAWVARQGQAGGRPRVAGFLPNRPEALWAWLGTLTAGAVYVALNRAHRGDLLADMVRRSGAELLVTDAEGESCLPDLADPRPRVISAWEEIAALEPAAPAAPAPGDLAELMYTSGTTGRSKAVELSHAQLCRGAGWVAWSFEMTAADVFHAQLPLFHIAGQVDVVLPSLVAGGAVALHPTFSRSRFWEQVAANGSTLVVGFPNLYRLLHSLPPREGDGRNSLRAAMSATMPPEFVADFEARFDLSVREVYGMTEAEPMVLPWPGEATPPGSCGRPNPDFEVAVLGDDGRPAAPGGVGEIVCRSRVPGIRAGAYADEAEASRAIAGNEWFHSGDLGRVDEDGFFYFGDRIRHAIRRRGESISSGELEAAVAGHPAVADVCAIGVPSPLGEEDVKVVVVPARGEEVEPAALRAWCEGRMAAFMVPRFVEVVAELPRAETGKVMKEELRGVGSAWDAEA
ncbi:MAG TPA: AMP-binding protein [Solirubrobacterales bacterium]|nr:AMP-binding protein [Solirubrobacterales bacterium]